MKIRDVLLAEPEGRLGMFRLPPLGELMYRYLVAGNGLFVQAEDARMAALVPVGLSTAVYGLVDAEAHAQLKIPRVPALFLWAILRSARRHLPDECLFHLHWEPKAWSCVMPASRANAVTVHYEDAPQAVVDLHSHAGMGAFFSSIDDADETGLRFYCVVGKVDTDEPQLAVRVGAYGYTMIVPATTVFEDLGPFVEVDLTSEAGSEVEEVSSEGEEGAEHGD